MPSAFVSQYQRQQIPHNRWSVILLGGKSRMNGRIGQSRTISQGISEGVVCKPLISCPSLFDVVFVLVSGARPY